MTTIEQDPAKALLSATENIELQPRYEGCNICTWIGFKHVNYLIEEAVLEHFRRAGLAAGSLYEEYGVGLDFVCLDTRVLTALHIDDVVRAAVTPQTNEEDGSFRVALHVEREGCEVKAAVANTKVALRTDEWHQDEAVPLPPGLERLAVSRIGPSGGPQPSPSRANGAVKLSLGRGASREDTILERLTAGQNAFGWKWRIPYLYCHFTERMQMSGYLRQMEEVVDLFLADRGISIWEMLRDRRWIPVVPHSRIELLDETLMEEDLYTVYTVERIFKSLTYTSRMDCYVPRGEDLVKTATGYITHGYAKIDNRRDWSLVDFDERVQRALRGESSG